MAVVCCYGSEIIEFDYDWSEKAAWCIKETPKEFW